MKKLYYKTCKIQGYHGSLRKKDHLTLAFDSKVESYAVDKDSITNQCWQRILKMKTCQFNFGERTFKAPMWDFEYDRWKLRKQWINQRLAQACGELIGYGLGSCRQLLHDDTLLMIFGQKWVGEQPYMST